MRGTAPAPGRASAAWEHVDVPLAHWLSFPVSVLLLILLWPLAFDATEASCGTPWLNPCGWFLILPPLMAVVLSCGLVEKQLLSRH